MIFSAIAIDVLLISLLLEKWEGTTVERYLSGRIMGWVAWRGSLLGSMIAVSFDENEGMPQYRWGKVIHVYYEVNWRTNNEDLFSS